MIAFICTSGSSCLDLQESPREIKILGYHDTQHQLLPYAYRENSAFCRPCNRDNLQAAWRSRIEYFIWMLKKGRKPRQKSPGDRWFVYLLRCTDGTLYTGIAKDVSRRCQQHNAGTASRYTRSRLPVVLVYQEAHASHSLALRREAAIKALSRQQKLSLIRLAG